ncbi:MAG: hypothetical protein Q9226_006421 [Calogaya cf. arnoldii]
MSPRFTSPALCLAFFLLIIQFVSTATIPRVSPRGGTSPFQNGKPRRHGLEVNPTGSLYCNGPYGISNKAGIPFSRANRGSLLFYGKGEGNTPDGVTDQWTDQGGVDDPKQSACGIPHNAYAISHVAIHPYWLKYAPLDRKPPFLSIPSPIPFTYSPS